MVRDSNSRQSQGLRPTGHQGMPRISNDMDRLIHYFFHHVFQEQQRALRQMEEMQALEEKRQRQQEMRNVLNLTLRMKMKKEAKEEQEQLAFDMKMLEQLLEESRNEAMEQEQRKV